MNYAEMRICFIAAEIWNGRKRVNSPGNMSDMFSGDASHSRRLFFRPAVGSLPSARHCSHVCGFLKSNWPFLPGRNCVRGMVRSHTWHVNGFAAASLDLCSFTALFVLPPSSPLISARQAWHLDHAPCGNNLKTKSSRVWTPNSFSNFQ